MVQLTDEIRMSLDGTRLAFLATASKDGRPNVVPIGAFKLLDDETLLISDQFFNKTLANLKVNQKVSVLFWDKGTAYQIYGTARYVNEGAEFTDQAAWVNAAFEQMGMPIKAKGGVYLTVTAVYSSCAGPDAGKQLA